MPASTYRLLLAMNVSLCIPLFSHLISPGMNAPSRTSTRSSALARLARHTGLWATAALLTLCYVAGGCGTPIAPVSAAQATSTPKDGETIVLIRHGETLPGGRGQLDCRGFNRSLALPKLLIDRFGAADAIFAPDPADQIQEGSSRQAYSYVRPLATIEPTAIRLELPVNTQLSYKDIADLQTAVTAPAYAHSTIFIAWEHAYAHAFAQQILSFYGEDPSAVPPWLGSDFETIYVFHITPEPTGSTGAGKLTFQVEQEGLGQWLTNTCPELYPPVKLPYPPDLP